MPPGKLFMLFLSPDSADYFQNQLLQKIFQEYHLIVKQIELRLVIVSEYDQEIPQSENRRQPSGIPWKSRSTIMRHQEDKSSKATSSLFPIKMMEKKERTTKHRTITDSHNGSNNKQKVNNNRTTALKRTSA